VKPKTLLVLRGAAGITAVATGWLAFDVFRFSTVREAGAGGIEFLAFWGLPIAAVSLFLGWFAVRGAHRGARKGATAGCFGGLLGSVSGLVLLSVVSISRQWDVVRSGSTAFLYLPLAGTLGMLCGIVVRVVRRRRRRAMDHSTI